VRAPWVLATAAALAPVGCGEGGAPARLMAGGDATIFADHSGAFEQAGPALSREAERQFFRGRALFRDPWVIAPSSTATRDGLGPVFNARACASCHVRDGRGRPPEGGEAALSMLVRVSVPGADPHGGPRAEPTYGGQLQPLGVPGVPGEAEVRVAYEDVPGAYADGTQYTLRRPRLVLEALAYGPMAEDALASARVAPMMPGLGLLAAVPEATLVALSDPDDADGDGISGRVQRVWDVAAGAEAVGRFGWKAEQPSVRQQTAGAFRGDLGITNTLFPEHDCTPRQEACLAARTGGEPELLEQILDNVAFYSAALAVPAPRQVDDPEVRRGEGHFEDMGCAGCHVPSLSTGLEAEDVTMAGQEIWPYTDLLLHDMGDALSDGRPSFGAAGAEWRTPPLWGIGLTEVVSGQLNLLHDGRARSFAEAILWHGGEGAAARDAFLAADAPAREALVRFLESL
jgi:CxxC motif-containing protein (DUF1111 family)